MRNSVRDRQKSYKRLQIIWSVVAVLAIILAVMLFGLPTRHQLVLQKPYPAGVAPDPKLTPGDVNTDITEEVVHSRNFRTGDYRNVTEEEKQEDAQNYHIAWADRRLYEFDHLIPLSCGGSNNLYNIWPEPLHVNMQGFDLGAKTKDQLEDRLGRMVKSGDMPLSQAQQLFRDWPAAYEQYVGDFPQYRN